MILENRQMAKKRVYDGKLLWETWCNWGAAASNPRLMEFSKQQFGRSSQMGPYYAKWKYAFDNPEKAYELWKEYSFNANPEEPVPTWEEFLLQLQKLGTRNPTIGGSRSNVERFCAKYGLEMDYRVGPNDVIQVVRPNHPLFQSLLVVDDVEGERVNAHYFAPDRNSYETANRGTVSCQVSVREIGVIGKAIV